MSRRVSYTAIVLDGKSQQLLRSQVLPLVKGSDGWEPLAHHMTINLGALDPQLNDPSILGQEKRLEVTHLGQTDLVAAVRVRCDVNSINEKGGTAGKHITLAVNKVDGGKPKFSNAITEWKAIQQFVLVGTVQEVTF